MKRITEVAAAARETATGRLSQSEPERQYFPGTPEDLRQRAKLERNRARYAGKPPADFSTLDFSPLEERMHFAQVRPQGAPISDPNRAPAPGPEPFLYSFGQGLGKRGE